MSEPQDKQNLPSDVAGDSPPAVETTAADNAHDNSGGRDLSKQNPLNQAAKGTTPGVPRAIRSRTGQTEDPVPEGKHIAEHKVRLPVAAQDDGAPTEAPQIAAAIAAGAHPQSDKEDKKAHKQELERLHGAALKHQNADNKRPGDFQHSNKMNMDSRRSHFGQKQHTSTQS